MNAGRTDLRDDELVRLWDGKDYLPADVRHASPELFELASRAEPLEEHWERAEIDALRRRAPRRRNALLAFGAGVIVGGGWLAAGASPGAALGWGLGGLLLTGLVLGIAYSSSMPKAAFPRMVSVDGGQVTLAMGKQSRSFPLAQASWLPGQLSDDTALASSRAQGEAVILLAPSGQAIACGLNADRRAVWQAFFELADVPRVRRFSKGVGCLLGIACLVASIVAGTGGYRSGQALQPVLGPVVGARNAAKVPWVAAVVCAWSAFMAVRLGVPGWYRGTTEDRMSLFTVSVMLPGYILGGGRKGLGMVRWPVQEKLAVMLGLGAALCLFAWLLARSAERRIAAQRLTGARHLGRDPTADADGGGDA